MNPRDLGTFDPDTLRDAADILTRWAAAWWNDPQTCPESWPVGDEWPDSIRRRCDRLADLGDVLARLADLGDES